MKVQRWSNRPSELRRLKQGGATSSDEQAAAKLIEGYPLPPADRDTVQRIWRRVISAPGLQAGRRPIRSQRWDAAALAPVMALCLVVALGVVVVRRRSQPAPRAAPPVVAVAPTAAAEIAAAQGGVFAGLPARPWQPVKEKQSLAQTQFVRTDASGRALMEVSGIASILLSRGTEVAIERLQGGAFLRLARGSVVARVTPRPPSEPFVILTRDYSVKVVGTLFQVDQDAADRTAVAVREGVVEVTGADGRRWRVSAGQRWSSGNPEQLGASAIADPVKTLLEEGLKRASSSDLERELNAVDGFSASAGAGATVDTGHASTGAGATENIGPRSPVSAARELSRAPTETKAPLPPPPLILAENDLPPSPAPDAAPAPAPAPGAYASGVALERAGQVQAAAETFAQAEKSDPAHAAVALYALGRLRQHRLQDPRGALEAFETYRAKYPNGPLLPEVDLAVLEIEVAAGHRDQALAESQRFLATHPASERVVEIHLLRGNLLRERDDCRSALAEYRQADSAGFAEEALFETAYCHRKLGDGSAARESLRRYQQLYPAGKHRDAVVKELRE